jgi:hypothetical protein
MTIRTLTRSLGLVAPIALLALAPALAMTAPTPGPPPINQTILVIIVGIIALIP